MEAGSPPPAPQPAENPELTPAVQLAIAEAVKEAVENARSPEEARESVPAAAQEEAEAHGVSLTDEERALIAEATVAAIEARGGFDQPPPSEPPAPPEGAQPEPGAGGPEGEAGGPPVGEAETPPERRSWAERFQGKGRG